MKYFVSYSYYDSKHDKHGVGRVMLSINRIRTICDIKTIENEIENVRGHTLVRVTNYREV